MKWYLWLIAVTALGCSTTKSTVQDNPKTDKKAQDVAFEVALKDAISSAHKTEMEAINAQTEILTRIEESVASLKPSSVPVKASETEEGPETLETDETTPIDAVGPVKVVKSVTMDWPSGVRAVYWYGTPCKHCETMEPVIEALKEMGVELREIEVFHVDDEGTTIFSEEAVKYDVRRAPTFDICKGSKVLKRFNGVCTIEEILDAVEDIQVESWASSCSPEKSYEPYQSLTRNPGPSWNWNGSWSPSNDYAERHLREAHGIETEGMDMSQMTVLHDNAHNASRMMTYSSPVKSSGTVRYSTKRNGGRFFGIFRSRSSCPGGNCH